MRVLSLTSPAWRGDAYGLHAHTSRSDPHGFHRVEAFWNSLSHGCANRDSSVSSSFPSRRNLGGCLAPPVMYA
jgi:hypothetical protein